MGLYAQFETDKNLEKEGIVIDYHDFRVRIARAGGANSKYSRILTELCKPYRRAIQTEALDPKIAERIEREAFAEAVVLDWETLVDPEKAKYQRGIESPDGGVLDFTVDNVIKTFENLPDLYRDLKEQANSLALFRKEYLEEDAKNSGKS